MDQSGKLRGMSSRAAALSWQRLGLMRQQFTGSQRSGLGPWWGRERTDTSRQLGLRVATGRAGGGEQVGESEADPRAIALQKKVEEPRFSRSLKEPTGKSFVSHENMQNNVMPHECHSASCLTPSRSASSAPEWHEDMSFALRYCDDQMPLWPGLISICFLLFPKRTSCHCL